MALSMYQCILHEDYEEAISRYETTTARWKNDWWETIVTIYNKCKEFTEKYILDPIKKILKKKEKTFLIYNCEYKGDDNKDKCYLFKFYFANETSFSKIGTTTRPLEKRLFEEVKTYSKKFGEVVQVVVESVFECYSIISVGVESFLRGCLIRDYPNTFLANDRFMTDVPKEKFDNYVVSFFESCGCP